LIFILPDTVEAVVVHVWKVLVQSGDQAAESDRLLILEAMKMESALLAESAGTITEMFCQPGQTVTMVQLLVAIQGELQ
jgi:urea carboxylase